MKLLCSLNVPGIARGACIVGWSWRRRLVRLGPEKAFSRNEPIHEIVNEWRCRDGVSPATRGGCGPEEDEVLPSWRSRGELDAAPFGARHCREPTIPVWQNEPIHEIVNGAPGCVAKQGFCRRAYEAASRRWNFVVRKCVGHVKALRRFQQPLTIASPQATT